MHFPFYFLYERMHFEKVKKSTPLGGLPPKNNVPVPFKLSNTLSSSGVILPWSFLLCVMDWLKQNLMNPIPNLMNPFFCFFCSLFGMVDLLQQRGLLRRGLLIRTWHCYGDTLTPFKTTKSHPTYHMVSIRL